MYFVPSYTYSALSLSLENVEINKIHRTFMPLLLNKLGFHSTLPRSIEFAPRNKLVIGIKLVNVIIPQRKIKFLYGHLRQKIH